jgi:hypothetical protein
MSRANLYALLAPLSPKPSGLIWTDQNGPRPAKPYSTLNIRTTTPLSPVKDPVESDGTQQIAQLALRHVEWEFYGLNASELAEAAALRLRTETTADRAKVLGLGICRVSAYAQTDILLNTSQFEQRAIIEIEVYDSNILVDDVGLIEGVDIDCFDHIDSVRR